MRPARAIPMALSIALALPMSAAAQQAERERRAADTGTAILRGSVLSGGSRLPLGDLTLRLRSVPDHRVVAETSTGPDGGFLFTKLRAGRYRVVVVRDDVEAHLGSEFVGVGAVVSMTFRKGTMLAGRVLNERGAPVSGIQVCALYYNETGEHSRVTLTQQFATTLVDGGFLIHDSTAGERRPYLLVASPDGCTLGVRRPQERLIATPAAFYPDALDAAEATVIDASPDRDRTGLVIRMRRGDATRVEGRLIGFENETVVPARAILEPAPGLASIVRTATVSPDGRFTFFGLRPGRYKVIVPPRADKTADQTYAITTFDVHGEAVLPITLKMQRALWIAGDVTFDGREQPYFGVKTYSSVTANPVYPRRDVGRLLPAPFSLIDARSRFMITGLLPIGYIITTQGFETLGWLPVEAVATPGPGGEPLPNAFTAPVSLTPGGGIFGMRVKFTARAGSIGGRVVDADGRPQPRRNVAILAATGATIRGEPWLVVRTFGDGGFESPVVLEGDYFVALMPDAAPIPREQLIALVEGLRPTATPVTVKMGEKIQVTLVLR